jgi:hypothetical protein
MHDMYPLGTVVAAVVAVAYNLDEIVDAKTTT